MERLKTQFILKGFKEVMGFRIFAFEGIGDDKSRLAFTVKADLALSRRYGIRLQELPLLCRAVLEQRFSGEERRAFTYSEEDMCIHADGIAEREKAAKQRRPPRRPAAGLAAN